jgi:hypothetical protein
MHGMEEGHVVPLTDQVRDMFEGPSGAWPPSLDLELIARSTQVLGRRTFRRQRRAQDLGPTADADRRVLDPVPERRERGRQVEGASQSDAAR